MWLSENTADANSEDDNTPIHSYVLIAPDRIVPKLVKKLTYVIWKVEYNNECIK